jgi:DNA-binding LytR/AlgR family response regulator
MMKVYLCEDNSEQKLHLQKIIENVILMENLDMEFSLATENPYILIDQIKADHSVGLYFLDIDFHAVLTVHCRIADEAACIDESIEGEFYFAIAILYCHYPFVIAH